MKRENVISKLKDAEAALRANGISALYLFGSYEREEAKENSDLDVFVDPVDSDAFGLGLLADSRALLERAFPGVEISLSTREGIVPSCRTHIEQVSIRVF